MINVEYLKEVMIQKGVCFEGLAYALGMNRSTLYRKLKAGKSAITLQDYLTIKKLLDLTPKEVELIFGEV